VARTSWLATVIWCAPALDYMPVRIEQHKGDKAVVMQIRSVEGIQVGKD